MKAENVRADPLGNTIGTEHRKIRTECERRAIFYLHATVTKGGYFSAPL